MFIDSRDSEVIPLTYEPKLGDENTHIFSSEHVRGFLTWHKELHKSIARAEHIIEQLYLFNEKRQIKCKIIYGIDEKYYAIIKFV